MHNERERETEREIERERGGGREREREGYLCIITYLWVLANKRFNKSTSSNGLVSHIFLMKYYQFNI